MNLIGDMPPKIDPLQDPFRPGYFMNYQANETEAEMVLRKLACWLGVGGYNATKVDAEEFHRKIVDGINMIVEVEKKRAVEDATRGACALIAELDDALTASQERVKELDKQLENERMRLVACDVIALANTRESAEKARAEMHPDYQSAALTSVIRAVDAEMDNRERVQVLEADAEIGRLAISYKKGLVKFVSEQSRPSTTNLELLMQLADENVANRKALDSAIDAALSTQENTVDKGEG